MTSHFMELLKRAEEIHIKKNQDYTSNPTENPYENFDRANAIAIWFPDNFKSFAILIGTKLARIAALLSSKRRPNNESIDDSFLDLVVYCILMYCYWKERQIEPKGKWVCTRGAGYCDHELCNPNPQTEKSWNT